MSLLIKWNNLSLCEASSYPHRGVDGREPSPSCHRGLVGVPKAGLALQIWVDAIYYDGGHLLSPIPDNICLLSLRQHEQAKRLWFMSSREMVSYSGKNIPAGISCLLLYRHRADKASAALASPNLVHRPGLSINQGRLLHLQPWVLKARHVCWDAPAWWLGHVM